MKDYLNYLNEQQKNAVTAGNGPVLVIAGAGSGKTRVLTNRIAWLIQEKSVMPYEIMAVTFTNKAAREMEERLVDLLETDSRGMWIGTFHRICLRILRYEGSAIGISPDFVIYDETDQKSLVKSILRELNWENQYNPKDVLRVISDAKNKMLTPESFEETAFTDEEIDIAKIYYRFEEQKKANNALDFDDLLLYAVDLFTMEYDVLVKYRSRFKWLLVDEYQDTNEAQYRLLKLLCGDDGNLFVVGDPDQSIYAFRGGNIENILHFNRDFPGAEIYRLEENYRSTKEILSVANRLIRHNAGRLEKELFTQKKGEDVELVVVSDERSEGLYVAETAKKLVKEGRYKYSDIAVFYRTHAQSRAIEDKLQMLSVPYKIFGGLRFYDRKEIKDTIAYLKLILNHDDNVSLIRIINEPRRGIGNTTIEKLQQASVERDVSIWCIINDYIDEVGLNKGIITKLKSFRDLIYSLHSIADDSITKLVMSIWDKTGYKAQFEAENTIENNARLENMEEFLTVTRDFDKSYGNGLNTDSGEVINNEEGRLWNFLSGTSLGSDTDSMSDSDDCVTMMTIHMAKGLEFPVVLLVGMEENVFPHVRSVLTGNDKDIEEERRLCYVGITRAREVLKVIRAYQRTLYGRSGSYPASRFITEMGIQSKMPAKTVKQRNTGFNNWGSHEFKAVKGQNMCETNNYGDLSLGTKVRHGKFGNGVIVYINVADDKVKVAFPDLGVKEFLLSYARLEKC